MSIEGEHTRDLLERWRGGDVSALGALLDRDLDWIAGYVRRHLGEGLRHGAETDDFVQEAAVAILKYGPRFVIDSRAHFRGLLAKITLNVLRSKHREVYALKRTPDREKPIGSGTVLQLDAPQQAVTQPDARVAENEEREWIRLGLLLLDAADQEILGWHWDGLEDAAIGERLGVPANTARMRRSRATGRLTRVVIQLKRGGVAGLVGDAVADVEG
jgi:RNA polymerase sigma factor (sigma-70 family)